MIVCKFGGTSVGTGERFAAAADRVGERRQGGCLAVVSAMARVTRELNAIAEAASAGGGDEVRQRRDALRERHLAAISEAGVAAGERGWVVAALEAELAEVERLAAEAAAAGGLADPARDRILAAGELISSRILAAVLTSRGVDALWVDPRDLVATDDRFGRARPDEAEIERRVAERARPALAAGRVVVTGGFVGRAPGGETTILGWEASDYSATLLGAALPADLVEIWSDVDGVYTADPRLVPGARRVPRMSYAEATDLAFFGAKVLHPATMEPVARRGVPVRIRNSFNPSHEGTLVTAEPGEPAPRGVAARGDLAPADVAALIAAACGARLLGELPAAAARAALAGEEVVPVAAPVPSIEDLERLAHESGNGSGAAPLALVSVVGSPWRTEVAGRVEAALAGIPTVAVPRNGCDTHRAFAVPEARRVEALERLERALFREAAG
ncbi:MAG TPA: aspartate kinase [Thermoanaerobaculia bacterium]